MHEATLITLDGKSITIHDDHVCEVGAFLVREVNAPLGLRVFRYSYGAGTTQVPAFHEVNCAMLMLPEKKAS